MLDVDFLICTDLRSRLIERPDWKVDLDSGKTVFVIPAFEFNTTRFADVGLKDFPRRKTDLLPLYADGSIVEFHNFWQLGHAPTNYAQWVSSQNDSYSVESDSYNFSYEPYVILRKDLAPWCDERFVGYGSNKAACLYEVYLAGFEFRVLPMDFIIHQRHEYPENERKIERRYNRRLYDHFREESCVRYNRMVSDVGNGDPTAVSETIPDRRNCKRFMREFMRRRSH